MIANGWVHVPGYTCRACGTVTTNKGAFWKCPVCGIKWD